MQTIRVLEKTGKDGVLHLTIPVGKPEAEFDVVVVVQPKAPAGSEITPGESGWLDGYIDLAGSITDESFVPPPQADLSQMLKRRKAILEKFLSGEWGVELEGFEGI